jgi:multidrug efflux pump subunit AcrB
VFSTFSAATPSIFLDIDRDKAQILKVDPSAIFQALQASLGGYYVNDMNLFGRTWQVQVQAEADDRASVDDIYRINVRSADDKMIPLRSLVEVKPVIGPQALIRYNNQIAVTVQGAPPGVSSGQALAAMSRSRRTRSRGDIGVCGPTSRSRKSARKVRPRSSSDSRYFSLTCSWWLCTRAGQFRSRSCCRSRSAWSGRSPRSSWRVSRSTYTPRLAW